MGRKARFDADGTCHHIIVKGINNSYIFNDDVAKDLYINLLKKYREEHDIKIFAYCVMDNHCHLLIQSGKAKSKDNICISDFMHDVQCAFAKWYNKTYARIGPVFNNRFNSYNCLSLPYFIYTINYIHRNPLKHGKTKSYYYRYSSFYDFISGNGLTDLADCYQFLGMSRLSLLDQLERLRSTEDLPFLDKLIERIRNNHDRQTIEMLLAELAYHIEDIRGSRLIQYFDKMQREIVKVLFDCKAMSILSLSKLLNVSPSYLYKQINSS